MTAECRRRTTRRFRIGRFAPALTAILIAAPGVQAAEGPGKEREAAVSAQPGHTSASYGDWVVRCDQVGQQGQRACEAAQSIMIKDQPSPIAQIAFGHLPADKADAGLTLTVLLPPSITFNRPPRLGTGAAPGTAADEPQTASLAFTRCAPGGCFAEAKPDAAQLRAWRDVKGPGHLTFTDAAERTITLPVSFRGLAPALDGLAAETAKAAAGH